MQAHWGPLSDARLRTIFGDTSVHTARSSPKTHSKMLPSASLAFRERPNVSMAVSEFPGGVLAASGAEVPEVPRQFPSSLATSRALL